MLLEDRNLTFFDLVLHVCILWFVGCFKICSLEVWAVLFLMSVSVKSLCSAAFGPPAVWVAHVKIPLQLAALKVLQQNITFEADVQCYTIVAL